MIWFSPHPTDIFFCGTVSQNLFKLIIPFFQARVTSLFKHSFIFALQNNLIIKWSFIIQFVLLTFLSFDLSKNKAKKKKREMFRLGITACGWYLETHYNFSHVAWCEDEHYYNLFREIPRRTQYSNLVIY